MVRRAFPTALAPIPSSRILLSWPFNLGNGQASSVRLSPDWFEAMFAPLVRQRQPPTVDRDAIGGLGGLWNGLVEVIASASDGRVWPTVIVVEIEPTEADVRQRQEGVCSSSRRLPLTCYNTRLASAQGLRCAELT